jgi:predicted N-acetyltransferase YhbS
VDTSLADGLVLRPATADDLPGAAQLLAARGDTDDARDLELVVATEGSDGVGVVVDGDRVVATATLLDETLRIDGLATPAGQIELVATDVAYEGRGLVRALVAWAHARSRERGHLLQVMIGIPYFYRQFGYEYVTPMAPWRPLTDTPTVPDDVRVRPAAVDDIPAMERLQARAQAGADVAMGHQPACWRWLVTGGDLRVAERAGGVVGVARVATSGAGAALAELAAADAPAALGLVADAASGSAALTVQDRLGTPPELRRRLGAADGEPDWYLARVERLGPLLVHLAPALQGRLQAEGLGDRRHEVLLSLWRSHVRFAVGPTGVTLLADGGAKQAPISEGGSGVPPDAVASLLLGPDGAEGLERRLPDCLLGAQRDLLHALFPPRTADLLTFYLPT